MRLGGLFCEAIMIGLGTASGIAFQYPSEAEGKFAMPGSSKIVETIKSIAPMEGASVTVYMRKGQTLIVQLVRDSDGSSISVSVPGKSSSETDQNYSLADKSAVLIRTAAADGYARVAIKNVARSRSDLLVRHLVCNTVEVADDQPVTLDGRDNLCLAHMKLNAGDARTIYVDKAKMSPAALSVITPKRGVWAIDSLTEYQSPIFVDFHAKATDDYYFYLNQYESRATFVARSNKAEPAEFSQMITGTIKTGEKKTYLFKAHKGDVLKCESNLPRNCYIAMMHQPMAYLSYSSKYAYMTNISSYQRIESYYKASHPDIILVKEDMDVAASIASYDPDPMPFTLKVTQYGTSMKVGDQVKGVLAVGDSAVYKVEGLTGQRFRVDMSSKEFDSLLYVNATDRYLQASNDDTGASLDSKMYFTVPATGTYYVVATSVGGGGGGKYTISLHEEKQRKLLPNELVKGDLRYQGRDTYIVDVRKGQKIIIYLKSKDCTITMYDSKGDKLEENLGYREGNPYLIWYEPKLTQTISVLIQRNEDPHYEFKWILVD